MTGHQMNPLFENALDSLRVGIDFLCNSRLPTAPKHSILNVYHSIELLLKEKLYRINPILIYRDIDLAISDDSFTIGLKQILARFRNVGIDLSEKDTKVLRDLQGRRNRIEHHAFKDDKSHQYVVGKAVRFIMSFMEDHLKCTLEEHVDPVLYSRLREIVLTYEERLREANEHISSRKHRSKGDCNIAICPDCSNETVLDDPEKGIFCFFCYSPAGMAECKCCGELVPIGDLDELDNCSDCLDYRISRF
jgi:hypothetical protein